MSLPSNWVDALFSRLSIRYGAGFVRQYEGMQMDAVKADWGNVLAFFADQPEAIKLALGDLPQDYPPNAMQFKALALRHAAPRHAPMLERAETPADVVAQAREKAKEIAKDLVFRGPGKEWAYLLMEREINGDWLNKLQRDMWRDAVGLPHKMSAAECKEMLAVGIN